MLHRTSSDLKIHYIDTYYVCNFDCKAICMSNNLFISTLFELILKINYQGNHYEGIPFLIKILVNNFYFME